MAGPGRFMNNVLNYAGEPGDLIYTRNINIPMKRNVMMIVSVEIGENGNIIYTVIDARSGGKSGIRKKKYNPKTAKGNLKFIGIGSLTEEQVQLLQNNGKEREEYSTWEEEWDKNWSPASR